MIIKGDKSIIDAYKNEKAEIYTLEGLFRWAKTRGYSTSKNFDKTRIKPLQVGQIKKEGDVEFIVVATFDFDNMQYAILKTNR
jgi:hypothetical protein